MDVTDTAAATELRAWLRRNVPRSDGRSVEYALGMPRG
jgi:hypothetical protein